MSGQISDPAAAEQLASFSMGVFRDGLDLERTAAIQQRIVDILGLLYGAVPLATSQAAADWARAQGGPQVAHAASLEERLPAGRAAFLNGVLAHSLDYDDTHLPSIVHPSASVVPAALAAAEAAGRSGGELIRAVAAGLEVCCRIGMAGYDPLKQRSVYFEHGQHATSICGTIGAATSAALLLDGDEATVLHAMGIAGSFASGVIEANRTGGTVKRMHCGWAAQAGVTAAELAQRGVTGPATVLEGRFGLLEAFLHDRDHAGKLTDRLGEHYELDRISFKPYPTNLFTHTSIDAAIALREQGILPADIERIRLGVASSTVRTIGEPIEVKRRPQTGYQAQFSGPYVFTAALFGGGGLGIAMTDLTDELATDPGRQSLMDRVEVAPHPDADVGYPEDFPCILDVTLRDGTHRQERVMHNRGGAHRPLTDDELAVKFRDNTGRSLDPQGVLQLETAAHRLDDLEQISELWP